MRNKTPISACLALLLTATLLAACGKKEQEVAAPAEAPAAESTTQANTATTDTAPAAETAPAANEGPVTHFRANGFSPAWEIDINGEDLTLDVPENASGPNAAMKTIKVTRSAYAKGVNYTGMDGINAVTLDIRTEPCNKATEDGKTREFTATLQYGKSTYQGCADAMR